MNFFQNQSNARKNTKFLVLLYILAVFLLIAVIYGALLVTFSIGMQEKANWAEFTFWQPELFTCVSGIILILISGGTFYKIFHLRSGGQTVAESLGGRLLMPNTTAADERRILNIVEEMAIASGIQIPQVYLLDKENSINAFAAGYNPNQAVIGISRGAIEQLTRDELQGVVAHEYSHILNGDMRLNIRLIGVLHGIMVLTLTGRYLLEASLRGGRRRSGKDNGSPILMVGLIVMVCGSIGVLLAKLIKMAVSRQREFLADASAVQFTRSPWGIAGALKKIGASSIGSKLKASNAEEVSHMCFANALSGWFSRAGFFSTHPPLTKRIKAIDPSFDGKFLTPILSTSQPHTEEKSDQTRPQAILPGIPGFPQIPGVLGMAASTGNLSADGLERASQIKASLPDELVQACHEPLEAIAVVCWLLITTSKSAAATLSKLLETKLPPLVSPKLNELLASDIKILHEQRLVVFEIALASLRYLSKAQYLQVKNAVQTVIEHDQEVTIFEFALYKIFTFNLDKHFQITPNISAEQTNLKKIVVPASKLLYALANFGNHTNDAADHAYNVACDSLGIHKSIRLQATGAEEKIGIEFLENALNSLIPVSPQIKEKVFEACLLCIYADQQLTQEEQDLVRVIAAVLECPLPL